MPLSDRIGPHLRAVLDQQEASGVREYYTDRHLDNLKKLQSVQPWTGQKAKVTCSKLGHERGCKACSTCHFCRQKTADLKTHCGCADLERAPAGGRGRGTWCGSCLQNRMGGNVEEALETEGWECPVCLDICNCSSPNCLRAKRNLLVTDQLAFEAEAQGFGSVAEYLILTQVADGPAVDAWERRTREAPARPKAAGTFVPRSHARNTASRKQRNDMANALLRDLPVFTFEDLGEDSDDDAAAAVAAPAARRGSARARRVVLFHRIGESEDEEAAESDDVDENEFVVPDDMEVNNVPDHEQMQHNGPLHAYQPGEKLGDKPALERQAAIELKKLKEQAAAREREAVAMRATRSKPAEREVRAFASAESSGLPDPPEDGSVPLQSDDGFRFSAGRAWVDGSIAVPQICAPFRVEDRVAMVTNHINDVEPASAARPAAPRPPGDAALLHHATERVGGAGEHAAAPEQPRKRRIDDTPADDGRQQALRPHGPASSARTGGGAYGSHRPAPQPTQLPHAAECPPALAPPCDTSLPAVGNIAPLMQKEKPRNRATPAGCAQAAKRSDGFRFGETGDQGFEDMAADAAGSWASVLSLARARWAKFDKVAHWQQELGALSRRLPVQPVALNDDEALSDADDSAASGAGPLLMQTCSDLRAVVAYMLHLARNLPAGRLGNLTRKLCSVDGSGGLLDFAEASSRPRAIILNGITRMLLLSKDKADDAACMACAEGLDCCLSLCMDECGKLRSLELPKRRLGSDIKCGSLVLHTEQSVEDAKDDIDMRQRLNNALMASCLAFSTRLLRDGVEPPVRDKLFPLERLTRLLVISTDFDSALLGCALALIRADAKLLLRLVANGTDVDGSERQTVADACAARLLFDTAHPLLLQALLAAHPHRSIGNVHAANVDSSLWQHHSLKKRLSSCVGAVLGLGLQLKRLSWREVKEVAMQPYPPSSFWRSASQAFKLEIATNLCTETLRAVPDPASTQDSTGDGPLVLLDLWLVGMTSGASVKSKVLSHLLSQKCATSRLLLSSAHGGGVADDASLKFRCEVVCRVARKAAEAGGDLLKRMCTAAGALDQAVKVNEDLSGNAWKPTILAVLLAELLQTEPKHQALSSYFAEMLQRCMNSFERLSQKVAPQETMLAKACSKALDVALRWRTGPNLTNIAGLYVRTVFKSLKKAEESKLSTHVALVAATMKLGLLPTSAVGLAELMLSAQVLPASYSKDSQSIHWPFIGIRIASALFSQLGMDAAGWKFLENAALAHLLLPLVDLLAPGASQVSIRCRAAAFVLLTNMCKSDRSTALRALNSARSPRPMETSEQPPASDAHVAFGKLLALALGSGIEAVRSVARQHGWTQSSGGASSFALTHTSADVCRALRQSFGTPDRWRDLPDPLSVVVLPGPEAKVKTALPDDKYPVRLASSALTLAAELAASDEARAVYDDCSAAYRFLKSLGLTDLKTMMESFQKLETAIAPMDVE